MRNLPFGTFFFLSTRIFFLNSLTVAYIQTICHDHMNPQLPSHFTQDPQLSLSSPSWSSYLSDLLMAWSFQFYSLFISHDGWHLLARVLKVFNKSYGFGTPSGTGKNEVLRCPSSTRGPSCVRRPGAKEAGEKSRGWEQVSASAT